MAGAATSVGHYGAGALHHGFPVGVGHVGHQNIAVLHLVHLADVGHIAHFASTNFLANSAALGQHGATVFQLVAHLGFACRLAFYRLGAGLQNINLPVGAVFAPLNVHRAAVVLFDNDSVFGQLFYVSVGQAVAVALLSGYVDGLHQLARLRFVFSRSKHHLNKFAT